MSTNNKKQISLAEWRLLKIKNLPKSQLNKLIMNYLLIEGYEESALLFKKETLMETTQTQTSSIHIRNIIRNLINNGEITKAIKCVNELNLEILDSNPILHFTLLIQVYYSYLYIY